MFKEMVHNCSAITKYSSSDLVIDETAYAHGGHRPVSDGLIKRIEGKTIPHKERILC